MGKIEEPHGRGMLKRACQPLDPALPEEVRLFATALPHANGHLDGQDPQVGHAPTEGEVDCDSEESGCVGCPGALLCLRTLMGQAPHLRVEGAEPELLAAPPWELGTPGGYIPPHDPEIDFAGLPGDGEIDDLAAVAVELADHEEVGCRSLHPDSGAGITDRR